MYRGGSGDPVAGGAGERPGAGASPAGRPGRSVDYLCAVDKSCSASRPAHVVLTLPSIASSWLSVLRTKMTTTHLSFDSTLLYLL